MTQATAGVSDSIPHIEYPTRMLVGKMMRAKVKLTTNVPWTFDVSGHPGGYPIYVRVDGPEFDVKPESETKLILPFEGTESNQVIWQVTACMPGELTLSFGMVNAYGVGFWSKKFTVQVA